jgi:hypothetical protein
MFLVSFHRRFKIRKRMLFGEENGGALYSFRKCVNSFFFFLLLWFYSVLVLTANHMQRNRHGGPNSHERLWNVKIFRHVVQKKILTKDTIYSFSTQTPTRVKWKAIKKCWSYRLKMTIPDGNHVYLKDTCKVGTK